MSLEDFVYCVESILLLDNDGHRLFCKYYGNAFAGPQQEREFEKKVHAKTKKANADIVLIDGWKCVYKSHVDLCFCVVGKGSENELVLWSVLNCFYDTITHILKKSVEKKTVFESLDVIMLAVDEICDSGIVLETDWSNVLSRIAHRGEELTFSEHTVAQVLQSAREQLKWSLLK